MTQDKIIEIAKEAGFNVSESEIIVGDYGNINTITSELAKFAELILARQEQPTPSQSEPVGVIHHKLAEDGKSGHVVWLKSTALMAENTMFYTKQRPTSQEVLDAERWNYYIEICSDEAAFELTGITDASNEQINSAIDAKMKQSK